MQLRQQDSWTQPPTITHPVLFNGLMKGLDMAERTIVVQQVDEISVHKEQGLIFIEQRDTTGNGEHGRICFPESYAKAVIDGIKAAKDQ